MGNLLIPMRKNIAQADDATPGNLRITSTVRPHSDSGLAQVDEQLLNGKTQNTLTDKLSTAQS